MNITYNKYKKNRRQMYLFVMTGMILLLTACGQKETANADDQPQQISGEANGDNTADSTVTLPENTENIANDAAQESTVRQPDITDEEALGIDDEIRQQLTEELLEENELDTSVMDSERSTRECTFELPEGFEESEEIDDLYVTSRYPLDTSMIYYAVLDRDTSMQLLTEELFKEQTEADLSRIYDEDIKIDIESFESTKISGYPAFRILCRYEVDDIKVTQLQYAINADKTYMIVYSQTSDYDWMEAFEESAATIKVR